MIKVGLATLFLLSKCFLIHVDVQHFKLQPHHHLMVAMRIKNNHLQLAMYSA